MKKISDLEISDGVAYLAEGYIDYAKEVIAERAIADLYDGLKPVNRRILWTAKTTNGEKGFIKSTRLSGNVLAYHPHGDSAVYKASIAMTDKRNVTAFPLLMGSGNFGDVSSGAGASAARYTEEMLHPNAKEMFGEMNGIDFMDNFDATLQEPKHLPVSFPYVLVNPSEGIAVGFSSKIPSFNFNDVIDLCIEYLEKGVCSTVIAPDFTTAGIYVKNNKELQKLMQVGGASLKLRGRVVVDGKRIIVTEVPFGKPVSYLKKQIDAKDYPSITKCGNVSDANGARLLIECRSKAVVDSVLYDLYRDTDLQSVYHANMIVIENGVPRKLGVWGIVERWVAWRRGVVQRHLAAEIEALKQSMRESSAFMKLIGMTDIKNAFVDMASREGMSKARTWLKEQVGDKIEPDMLDFVTSRSLTAYHDGGKYRIMYDNALATLNQQQAYLDNIDAYLIEQLKGLKAKYGVNIPRRTEVTNVDYNFVKEEEEQAKPVTPCVYALKDNFIRKLSYFAGDEDDFDCVIKATSEDTIIGFDNRGRIIRLYADGIPMCGAQDLGMYVPRYLGIEETDDYRVMWLGLLDGDDKMILYGDGHVGFLDTSEFVGAKRQVKVLERGVSTEAWNAVALFSVSALPEVLMVLDNEGRISWTKVSDIRRKGRTARTRVFDIKKGCHIAAYRGMSGIELLAYLNNYEQYQAPKVGYLLDSSDYRGGADDFSAI